MYRMQEQLEQLRQWSRDEYAFERLAELFEAQASQVNGNLSLSTEISPMVKAAANTDLYRILVSYMPNTTILLFDKNLQIIFAEGLLNSRFEKMEANYVGKKIRDLFPLETYERDEHYLLAAFAGSSSTVDIEYMGRFYFVQIIPMLGEDGTVEQGMLLSQDITERKLTELALRDSQARFRDAFEHSPIGIALVELNGTWIKVNRQVEKITGYSESELLTMNYHDVTPAEDWAHDAETIQRLIQGDIKTSQLEKQFVRKDGQLVWVLCSASTVCTADGTPLHFVLQIVDIDQQQHVVEELERTNRDLKEFAEIVSHDLKAPLYAMSSLMQQLQVNAGNRLSTRESEIIDLILEEVQGMDALIEGVLSYSRLSFEGEEKTPIDLNELVAHIIRIIAPLPHIKIKVANTLPTLRVDATKISQVFLNLLSNAVKYNDKSMGVIIVRCVQSERGWLFSVADNGRGIDEKDFATIFQVFKGNRAANHGRSSGMGLPFVKKIIESYGGQVWLNSKVGSGTVFYFRLPIAE